jgi:hypothetical protein
VVIFWGDQCRKNRFADAGDAVEVTINA